MITKEKFRSFPLNKRFLIAASDLARAENLLKDGLTELAEDSINTACGFLEYLFEDDPSLKDKLPSAETCRNYVSDRECSKIHDSYEKLMGLAGVPVKAQEAR
jgi:hypothetical protein